MEWRDFCRNTVDNSCSGDAETKLDPELEKMLEGNHLEPLRNALADAGISSMDGFLETDLLNFMIERELYSVTRCKAIVASLRAKIEKVRKDRKKKKAIIRNPVQEKMTSEEQTSERPQNSIKIPEAEPVSEDDKSTKGQPEEAESKIAQIEALSVSLSQKAYLKCIAKLTDKKQWTRQNEIANSLGYSKPSVSVAIKQLKSDGYIIDEGGYIKLNDDRLNEQSDGNENSQSEKIRTLLAKIEELPVSLSQKEYLKCTAKLNEVKRIVRRKDIADSLGFSRASVTMAIKQLIAMGYIIEEDECILLNDLIISGGNHNTENHQEKNRAAEYDHTDLNDLKIEEREKRSDIPEAPQESHLKADADSDSRKPISLSKDFSVNQETLIDSLSISESFKAYLKCIIDLNNKLGNVRQKDIAAAMGYTGPSVSVAVKQLQEMGFVSTDHGYISVVDLTSLDQGDLLFKQVTGIQKQYLYSIARLTESGTKVRKTDIAADMGYSRAAVTLALKKMEQDNLVHIEDGYVELNKLIEMRIQEEMRRDNNPDEGRKPPTGTDSISKIEMEPREELPSGKDKDAGKETEAEPAFSSSDSERRKNSDSPALQSMQDQIETSQTEMTLSHKDETGGDELQKDNRDTETKPVAYTGTDKYIFMSYSHRDADKVYPLIHEMISNGFRVWYDEGIEPGAGWDDNVAVHIENSEMIIAVLSRNYLESDNCRDELNFARDLGKKTILVYIEKTELPAGMRLRFNRLFALHQYELKHDDFYRKLNSVKEIHAVREIDNNK